MNRFATLADHMSRWGGNQTGASAVVTRIDFERIERQCRDGPDTGVWLMLRGADNFLVGVFAFTELAILTGFGGCGLIIVAFSKDNLK